MSLGISQVAMENIGKWHSYKMIYEVNHVKMVI